MSFFTSRIVDENGVDLGARIAWYDPDTKTYRCDSCELGLGNFASDSARELLAHMDAHVDAGLIVPEHALQCIAGDVGFLESQADAPIRSRARGLSSAQEPASEFLTQAAELIAAVQARRSTPDLAADASSSAAS